MSEDIYKRLARHLDVLPAGYPETESGVELRILKRLFTPEEAELTLHTTLIPETAKVIARRAGLVLQPNNAKRLTNICCCCGCCCQILIHMKKHPRPAEIVSTPFTISHDRETCKACGVCVKRCQMDAVSMEGEEVYVNPERCIGCGLCVSTCPTLSLVLARKPEQTPVPEDVLESYKATGRARGKMGTISMAKMTIRSKWDRTMSK